MSLIKLAIDRQSRRLVTYNGSASSLPDLFQGNNQSFQIQFVDPATSGLGTYTPVDMAGTGLRVSIGATPTGTAGSPTPLAIQNTWTWNSGANQKYFTGSIALNVAAIDSFIGTAAQATAYFEINSTSGGDRITELQTQCTLKAVKS